MGDNELCEVQSGAKIFEPEPPTKKHILINKSKTEHTKQRAFSGRGKDYMRNDPILPEMSSPFYAPLTCMQFTPMVQPYQITTQSFQMHQAFIYLSRLRLID